VRSAAQSLEETRRLPRRHPITTMIGGTPGDPEGLYVTSDLVPRSLAARVSSLVYRNVARPPPARHSGELEVEAKPWCAIPTATRPMPAHESR